MLKKIMIVGAVLVGLGVVLFIGLQLLPGPGWPSNPPVVAEPQWDSPQTRALAQRACFACHSNETVWPWYAYVAPVRWLVVGDTEEGRGVYNFSDWHSGDMSGEDAADEIASGGMPPDKFLIMHPEAKLTEMEKQQLRQGLQATLK